MVTGVSRWENDEPLSAIDAQIQVMTVARTDCTRALIEAEQDVIAAMVKGDRLGEVDSRRRVASARQSVRDFTAELDELRTERARVVPAQRGWPR